ncbi:MAG: hypothetical protein ACI4J1_05035 [Ruminiclostridium sp.]
MKSEIAEYKKLVKKTIEESSPETDWERFCEDLYTRIGFYQHERLVHLIVTMTFAVMTVLCLVFSGGEPNIIMLLGGLFLLLEIPYIWHYYFLENSVQELYTLYYKAKEKLRTKQSEANLHTDK